MDKGLEGGPWNHIPAFLVCWSLDGFNKIIIDQVTPYFTLIWEFMIISPPNHLTTNEIDTKKSTRHQGITLK